MAGWEVGAGAGRFWRTSSGGGTGRTTGEALDGSLLTSKTSIGPEELLRRIWHFLCPLMGCIWTQTKTELTRSQSVHFNCLSLLCRTYIFWPGHLQLCADGSANCQECFICKKNKKTQDWSWDKRSATVKGPTTSFRSFGKIPLNAPHRSSCLTYAIVDHVLRLTGFSHLEHSNNVL